MNLKSCLFCFLILSLAGLGGCSSAPSGQQSTKSSAARDKIQGKAQINLDETTSSDAALNAGGPSVYLIDGLRHYRLFFNKPSPVEVEAGKEYIAEGIDAQKAIDDIGDPDKGKDGYPLQSSCRHVVTTAWPGLAFDVTDGHISVLYARVKRYPARHVFLVTRFMAVAPDQSADAKKKAESEEEDAPEVSVPAAAERAVLIAGPAIQPAPLWDPAGGTISCKVVVGRDGKISELETGAQLCESVPWSQFSYKPTMKGGHAVKVKTEVEVRFQPRT